MNAKMIAVIVVSVLAILLGVARGHAADPEQADTPILMFVGDYRVAPPALWQAPKLVLGDDGKAIEEPLKDPALFGPEHKVPRFKIDLPLGERMALESGSMVEPDGRAVLIQFKVSF